jgi:putative acetyltransferase
MTADRQGVTLRRGAPADAAALHRLSLRAIETSAAEHYSPQERAAWSSLRSVAGHALMIAETYLLVAEVDGEVAGFANLETDSGLVDQLFVDPSSGGRGVARRLLDGLESQAVALRLPALVSHASRRAVGVFERCGYQRVELERVTVAGLVLERYHVRKELPADGPP